MLSENHIWLCDWDNAPKHLQRYLYAGRIFCFEFDKDTYCFGRIMAKTLVGHIAEIFDNTSRLPRITEEALGSAKRAGVFILDSDNLFARNTKHNWRIIGNQRDYSPKDTDGINYRIDGKNKKVDFFGNVTDITESEAAALPSLIPLGDEELKQALAPKLGKEYVPSKPTKKKPELKIWGWDKKPRTMLRHLDAGMIFCFKFDDNKYCFGRLMTKCCVGHIAEFFDHTSSAPEFSAEFLSKCKRVSVQIIDSYSLFDRRSEGEWRIIGACGNYVPTDVGEIKFYFGIDNDLRLLDFFDHQTKIPPPDAEKYPPLSPLGDFQIKTELSEKFIANNK